MAFTYIPVIQGINSYTSQHIGSVAGGQHLEVEISHAKVKEWGLELSMGGIPCGQTRV